MNYLLDSNVCIESMRKSRGESVRRRLGECGPDDVVLCAPVRAELLYGALHSRDVERNLRETRDVLANFPSLPFDDAAAEHAASIRNELAAKGTPIGPMDLLIAAIARANGLTLVSHNTAEFGKVSGLLLEDWQRA